MRLFAAVLLIAIVVACGSATAPDRMANCVYPGDTIGFAPLVQTKDSVIIACIFVEETQKRCYRSRPTKYHASDCVVGQKWTG